MGVNKKIWKTLIESLEKEKEQKRVRHEYYTLCKQYGIR